jgi:hypothetical protein
VNPGTDKPGDSDVKGNKEMNDALREAGKRRRRPANLPPTAADPRNQWILDLAYGKQPAKDE